MPSFVLLNQNTTLLRDIDYLLQFLFNSSYFKVKLCIFNETIIEKLYLSYLTVHLPNTQIKLVFTCCGLIMN